MINCNEKKFIIKLSTLILLGLFITDFCICVNSQTSNNSFGKEDNRKPTHVTSININSPKTCQHTLADGSKVTSDCSADIASNRTDSVGHTNVTVKSTKEKLNTTTINTTSSTTTENSEVASMTDSSHKYTGGLDVDEIKSNNNTTIQNKTAELSTPNSNISVNNEVIPKKVVVLDHSGNNKSSNVNFDTSLQKKNDSKNFRSTTAAGIAAAICVALACIGYVSLMVWRRIFYQRYGNREMLLNEDDLGDIHDEDMRHFELKLLNKDGKVIES